MKSLIILILSCFFFSTVFAQSTMALKKFSAFSLATVENDQTDNSSPTALVPTFKTSHPGKNYQQLSGVAENVYGLIIVVNDWVEKQKFWNPKKGFIIPLSIRGMPVQFLPSIRYDSHDSNRSKIFLGICVQF
jgi:hypothetical protein